jgi:hypothetical protein
MVHEASLPHRHCSHADRTSSAKAAFRNLWKQKLYTLINLLGLATGIACFVLIGLYVQYQRGFDRFVPTPWSACTAWWARSTPARKGRCDRQW